MDALVVLSGGLDSTVVLAHAIKEHGWDSVGAISFNYGQKHKQKELEAAASVAAYYRINTHEIVKFGDNLFVGSGSALVDGVPMPELSYDEIRKAEGPSPTYVPFRNANLLAQAVAYALSRGAGYVYYGAHAEDARNFAYPDCTPEFNGAFAAAVYIGTYHKVRLVAPLQNLSKAGVVAMGANLRVPFSLTWSCYNGGEKHCGVCPTCIGRREAFKENFFKDPVEYEK